MGRPGASRQDTVTKPDTTSGTHRPGTGHLSSPEFTGDWTTVPEPGREWRWRGFPTADRVGRRGSNHKILHKRCRTVSRVPRSNGTFDSRNLKDTGRINILEFLCVSRGTPTASIPTFSSSPGTLGVLKQGTNEVVSDRGSLHRPTQGLPVHCSSVETEVSDWAHRRGR